MSNHVISVSASPTHSFSKADAATITLIAGQGVQGDAHCGVTVKHRSRAAQNPTQPNLRQVHLMHSELFTELAAMGFTVGHGQLGENILTQGIDLLALPVDTALLVGRDVVLSLTGLRNPCSQIDKFQKGLMAAVLDRASDGTLIRKAGVMSVVRVGGLVRPGDEIRVKLPATPHRALKPV